MKKLNNKGVTLVELIVSFALVAVAIVYFYQTLYTVRKLYTSAQRETNDYIAVNYAFRLYNEYLDNFQSYYGIRISGSKVSYIKEDGERYDISTNLITSDQVCGMPRFNTKERALANTPETSGSWLKKAYNNQTECFGNAFSDVDGWLEGYVNVRFPEIPVKYNKIKLYYNPKRKMLMLAFYDGKKFPKGISIPELFGKDVHRIYKYVDWEIGTKIDYYTAFETTKNSEFTMFMIRKNSK